MGFGFLSSFAALISKLCQRNSFEAFADVELVEFLGSCFDLAVALTAWLSY